MDFEIVPVTSPAGLDFRGIARLTIVAWGRQVDAAEVDRRARDLEMEVGGLDQTMRGIFIAKTPTATVGFCRTVRDADDRTYWWLIGIVVHSDRRRLGIGKALVLDCIAYARARGARAIRSETHANNDLSICFHEGVGFSNDGRFTAADGDEKIAFSLELH